jgi:hypothetical protein
MYRLFAAFLLFAALGSVARTQSSVQNGPVRSCWSQPATADLTSMEINNPADAHEMDVGTFNQGIAPLFRKHKNDCGGWTRAAVGADEPTDNGCCMKNSHIVWVALISSVVLPAIQKEG